MFIIKMIFKHITIQLQKCVIFNLITTIFTLTYTEPVRQNIRSVKRPFAEITLTEKAVYTV